MTVPADAVPPPAEDAAPSAVAEADVVPGMQPTAPVTVRPAPREAVGRAVCAAVNHALRPRTGIAEQRSANLLRAVVTDREQLRQLDHRIAGIVASAVTGRRGPRAFRDVPYRRLRDDWGLRSLVVARNAHGGGRG